MILAAYMTRRYLGSVLMILATFTCIFVIVDLFDNIDTFIDRDAATIDVVRFYWHQVPYIVLLTLPVAALVGCFFSVGGLARHGEINAMRASGMSRTRILLPVFASGLLLSGIAALMAATVVPMGERTANDIERAIQGRSPATASSRSNLFYVGKAGDEYFMKRWDGRRSTMRDVVITRTDGQSRVVEQLRARKGLWTDGVWTLEDGSIHRFSDTDLPSYESFETRAMPELPEEPADFSTERRKTRELTLGQLRQRIRALDRSGEPVDAELTDLHLRFSFPASAFVLVLFGAPLACGSRKESAWWGFTVYVVVGFLFLTFTRFMQTLGEHGTVSPLTAAWLPDLAFGVWACIGVGWRQFR